MVGPTITGAPTAMVGGRIITRCGQRGRVSVRSAAVLSTKAMMYSQCGVRGRLRISSNRTSLCLYSSNHRRFITGVCGHGFTIGRRMSRTLHEVSSPCITGLCRANARGNCPMRVLPFCREKSLRKRAFSRSRVIQVVVPYVGRKLRTLRATNVVRGSLGPSGVVLGDSNRAISVVSFNVDSFIRKDGAILIAGANVAPRCSTPRAFGGLFLGRSSCCSFNVALFRLFYKCAPCTGVRPRRVRRCISMREVPCPSRASPLLRSFVSTLACCSVDGHGGGGGPGQQ